jgi:chromosome partitioning protein
VEKIMAVTVSFINFKGGVGKTTLCVEIAASLAAKFKDRVLIVDLDPQTNATFSLVTEETWENHANSNGTLKDFFQSCYEQKPMDIDRLIIKSPVNYNGKLDKLDILPSHIELFGMDLKLATRFGPDGIDAKIFLREALKKIHPNYDYIFFDCPPNLYLATQNGLFASDKYVIVALAEYLSTLGIAHIQKSISSLFEGGLPTLSALEIRTPDLLGIIFNRLRTRDGGTANEQGYIYQFRSQYGDKVFETTVPQSTRIAERPEQKVPIAVSGYAADKVYEKRMEDLAKEFYDRITRPTAVDINDENND